MRIQYFAFSLLILGCNSTGHYNADVANTLPKSVALEFLSSWDNFTVAKCHFNPTTMSTGNDSPLPYEEYTLYIFNDYIRISSGVGFVKPECGMFKYSKNGKYEKKQQKAEKLITALKAMGVKG